MALEKRLRKRLEKTVQTLGDAPDKSIPQACGTMAETHAVYCFFENERVSHQDILAEHQSETLLKAQAARHHHLQLQRQRRQARPR